jgi:hypothetical protein
MPAWTQYDRQVCSFHSIFRMLLLEQNTSFTRLVRYEEHNPGTAIIYIEKRMHLFNEVHTSLGAGSR